MPFPNLVDYAMTITVASGQSLSAAVDLNGSRLLGLICPTAIEATTVQVSFWASDALAGTYTQVKKNGTAVTMTFAINDFNMLTSAADLAGVRFLKIRCETAVPAAVAQTSDRVFKIIRAYPGV